MAEVKVITAHLKVLVNTAQYESAETFVRLEATLDDFDDPVTEQAKLYAQAEAATLNSLRAIYKARGKSTSAKMIAKQHGITFHG